MFPQLSAQLYRYERGLSTAEQRAADLSAGEAAAALRDLRLRLGRAFGRRGGLRLACGAEVVGSQVGAPPRVSSGIR
jgi:hypothetical protein